MSRKTDLQLMKIIEYDFEKYNAAAIDCAKKELGSRNLNYNITEELRSIIKESFIKEKLKEKNVTKIISSGKKTISKTLDAVNPLTQKKDKTLLNLIAIYIGLLLCSIIYQNYYQFLPEYVSIYSLETLLVTIVLSVSIYGIILNKQIGWILLVGYFSLLFSVYSIDLIISIIDQYETNTITKNERNFEFEYLTNVDTLIDHPRIKIGVLLSKMFVSVGLIWTMSKSSIKSLFNISDELGNKTKLVGSISGIAIWGLIFWSLN